MRINEVFAADAMNEKAASEVAEMDDNSSSRQRSAAASSCAEKKMSAAGEEQHQGQHQLERDDVGDVDSDTDLYPSTWKLVVIVAALCLAVFLVALDQTIVSTAIPTITDHFHSVNDIGWYGSSYLLARAALQPTFGRIYSHFDVGTPISSRRLDVESWADPAQVKWTFLVTIAIFELGSLVCATAPSSDALIVGRAIAGAGVGGLFTGSIVIVLHCMPLRKRPAILGIIGSTWAIASVAGPLLGGVFTSEVSWRWCFYINLPIGAVTIVAILFMLHVPQDNNPENLTIWQRILKLDLIGTCLVIPATICLLLPLQWGGTTYPWNDSRIIGLFVGAGCLTVLLIYSQIRLGDEGTLPPFLFKNRNTLGAFLFSAFFGAAFYSLAYYLAVYFQAVKGSSALNAGIKMLPLLISCSISSTATGFLISGTGYYTPFMIICMAMFAAGAGALTTLAAATPYWRTFGFQVLAGLGVGVGFEAGIIVVQTVVPGPSIPVAISVTSFLMTIGGAVFLPVSQAVFQHGILREIQKGAPQLDAQAFLQSGATEFRSLLASLGQLDLLPVVIQAYVYGVRNTFWVVTASAVAAFVAACTLDWKSIKDDANDAD